MINDFDQVKDAVNIKALVLAETGLSMKGHHLSECPFCHGHECFSIKEDEGYFNCFQCDEAGDIFSFLKKLHGIESAAALKQAAVFGNITLSQRESVVVHSGLKDQIFNEAREYYHEHFKSNGGRAYFQARGHGSEVLERMKIGWTDGKLAQYLLDKFSKEDVLSSGLAREKDGVVRDLFGQGVAVFPHQDRGRTIHFTIKDPEKKQKHQLPAKFRDKWLFYKQDVLHKYQELILVEGENDLLSVMTAGVDYVMAIIGQISEEQLKALKKYCHGKHLYLWFDNDESGRKYVRKVCDTLKNINIRIIVQPNGKDPDEYLRDITEEQKRKAIKILKEASITPVAWEIMVAGDLPGLDEKYAALKEREIFTKIGAMVEIEQHIYSDKLTKIGFKESAIQKELDLSRELLQEIGAYMAELHHMKDADPLRIARIMFAGYTRQGRFYSDRRENVYLLFQNRIYIVGNNRPFNAMVMKTTGLIPTKEPGRSVWESLASEAYNNGKEINLSSWLFTSQKQDAIYANLNSVNNIIIKVSPNKIEEIQNGLNDDSVLLKSSQKIMPFNYLPDCEVGEGFKYLGELIFNSLTCEREQRYLILCWFMSSFLIELSPYMALMKFSGESGSGKTTAAKLISCLIYGDGHLGDASTAAAYAEASQNPLLIIDNLESGDMTKSMLKFLLLVCTGGSK
ncbi:toprim domain-containing protein, partial [bacterium]|nr:toprim domain-containing protein [bacterium]